MTEVGGGGRLQMEVDRWDRYGVIWMRGLQNAFRLCTGVWNHNQGSILGWGQLHKSEVTIMVGSHDTGPEYF